MNCLSECCSCFDNNEEGFQIISRIQNNSKRKEKQKQEEQEQITLKFDLKKTEKLKETELENNEEDYNFLVKGSLFKKRLTTIRPFSGEWRNILEYKYNDYYQVYYTERLFINENLYFVFKGDGEGDKVFVADGKGKQLSEEIKLPDIKNEDDDIEIIFSSELTKTAKAIKKKTDNDYFSNRDLRCIDNTKTIPPQQKTEQKK